MTPKNRVHTARRIRKGAFLSGHCGGGPEKRAPANGWVLTFSTAWLAKNDGKPEMTEEVFVSDELLEKKARKR